jgi:DNA-binding PadR family transcriptional regulator
MLDNIILGLLLFKSLSIYRIKKAIEEYVSFFYSPSYGNIIPALKKLEKNKLVTIREVIVNGRNNKEYTITEKGRESFRSWLSKEISIGKTQNEALLRLYFLTELPQEKQIELLNSYVAELKTTIKVLRAVGRETMKMEIPEKYREAFNYRIATLDFGLQYYRFEMKWYNNIIRKIKNKEMMK